MFESHQAAYVEVMAYPKWISRASERLRIAMGNHNVFEVLGRTEMTEDTLCFHAPLRARFTWVAKALDRGYRAEQLGLPSDEWWQARKWYELATQGPLEPEWRANSYKGNCLDVYGTPHPVIPDLRLRELVELWVQEETSQERNNSG